MNKIKQQIFFRTQAFFCSLSWNFTTTRSRDEAVFWATLMFTIQTYTLCYVAFFKFAANEEITFMYKEVFFLLIFLSLEPMGYASRLCLTIKNPNSTSFLKLLKKPRDFWKF